MSMFKQYLKTVLNEAVVVNPEKVDQRLKRFADVVTIDECKKWVAKKARAFIFNNPSLLVVAPPKNASAFPDYAQAAISRGETVYAFDHTAPQVQEFLGRLSHITDWFRAMAAVLNRKPTTQIQKEDFTLTQKAVSKLMKLSFEQAYEAADAWYAHMGSRAETGVEKTLDGAEVVHEWPDGFYAVRYTKRDAMVADGRDLQNCLAQGNYWAAVQRGSQQVYGIRKPNDEAVIGLRVEGTLQECKGKNNKPVAIQYKKYAIDFLNAMRIPASTVGQNPDLKAAGIASYRGRYGDRKELASVVYNQDGILLKRVDDEFWLETSDFTCNGAINNDQLTSFTTDPKNLSVEQKKTLCFALNHMKLKAFGGAWGTIEMLGIAHTDETGFVLLREQGELLATIDGIDAIRVGYSVYGLDQNGSQQFVTDCSKTQITGISFDTKSETAVKILNLLKRPPNRETMTYLLTKNIAYGNKKYGLVGTIAKLDVEADNAAILIIDSPKQFIYHINNGVRDVYIPVSITKNQIAKATAGDADSKLWQQFVDKHGFVFADKDEAAKKGILEIGGKSYGSFETFWADFPRIAEYLRGYHRASDGGVFDGQAPWATHRRLCGFLVSHEDSLTEEVSKQIIVALGPTDKFIETEQLADHKVYDISVKQAAIKFPVAAWEMAQQLSNRGKFRALAHRAMTKWMRRATKDALTLVKNNPDTRFSWMLTRSTMFEFDDILAPLDTRMRRRTAEIEKLVNDRIANADKYVDKNDVSQRFAALTAAGRLKRGF